MIGSSGRHETVVEIQEKVQRFTRKQQIVKYLESESGYVMKSGQQVLFLTSVRKEKGIETVPPRNEQFKKAPKHVSLSYLVRISPLLLQCYIVECTLETLETHVNSSIRNLTRYIHPRVYMQNSKT